MKADQLLEWTLCEVRDEEDNTAVLWVKLWPEVRGTVFGGVLVYRSWSNETPVMMPTSWRVVKAEPRTWELG